MQDLLSFAESHRSTLRESGRDAGAARIAEHRQGSRRSLRRGAVAVAGFRRRARRAAAAGRRAAITCARSSTEPAAPILLLGHFDTVWSVGQLERMPFREEDGRLHGPGIFDMKAGIAVRHAGGARGSRRCIGSRPRVVMLWTTDEEIGSGTSRAFHRGRGAPQPRRAGAGAVASRRRVKTSRKGCGDFELTVHGVSAHAGIDPGRGANAIHELAYQIGRIQSLQDARARRQRQRRTWSRAGRGRT